MSTTTRILPPLDGSVNLADVVDFNLKHNPLQPLYAFSTEEEPDIVTIISHLEFSQACHRVAHLLRPNGDGDNGAVVVVVALVDTIVYQAIVVGLVKAGLVPFPISPRNSPAAIVHLLRKTSAHRLITTEESLGGLVDAVRSELDKTESTFDLKIEAAPSLQAVYPKLGHESENDIFEPYSFLKKRPALTDVALYVHSSGSTGFPKPIPETYQALCEWSAMQCGPAIREHPTPLRMGGMALPAFHTLGVYVQILLPLYGLVSSSVFPPVVRNPTSQPNPPTSDNVLEHLRRTQSNSLMIIPALLNGIAETPEGIELLKDLKFVAYGGGPVPRKLAESLISAGVNLQSAYGASEVGASSILHPNREHDSDWEWMEFSDEVTIRWVPQGDGTYEAQYLTTEKHHPSVENIKDTRGYATSDLFEQHPTKKNLWRIVGRIDDVIIHSSGEKTVPAPMEDIMSSSPLIRGVAMFGREHDQVGVLLEPVQGFSIDVSDHIQLATLRNQVWPIVEAANKNAPAFSRIFKEMILVTSPQKPLPRSSKGTIMRKAALQAYDAEIRALYETVESSAGGGDVAPPTSWDKKSISEWLTKQAKDIQNRDVFSPSKDLFEQGFDSLSATFLRLRIVAALRNSKDITKSQSSSLSQNIVYSYPTIDQLATFMSNFAADPERTTQGTNMVDAIEDMISKYSAGLEGPVANISDNEHTVARHTVLITGTTGNLGSQTLSLLLLNEGIDKVYAFNRPSSSRSTLARHEERFVDKGLDTNLLKSEKLVLVEGDSTEEHFGLPLAIYEQMRLSVTLIIHIAWRLDFNLTLNSFEANIRGTRNLVDFARSGPHASTLRFLYTSSIASAQSWDAKKGPYPEEVVYDARYAVGGGYGEGKYVTERILEKSGIHATSFRLGQVSGGQPNGAWATSDWVPILVKSSLALGAMPNGAGVISWLPMDATAQVLMDVAFSNEAPSIALNLVHAKPVSWNYMISSMRAAVTKAQNVKTDSLLLIPMKDWISRLEKYSKQAGEEDFKRIPAIKLLEFFRVMAEADAAIIKDERVDAESGGLADLSTYKTQNISRTLRELRPFEVEDAERWVSYWKSVGFFD